MKFPITTIWLKASILYLSLLHRWKLSWLKLRTSLIMQITSRSPNAVTRNLHQTPWPYQKLWSYSSIWLSSNPIARNPSQNLSHLFFKWLVKWSLHHPPFSSSVISRPLSTGSISFLCSMMGLISWPSTQVWVFPSFGR